jgi:predicted Zn-dependent protease with MMP-like domain
MTLSIGFGLATMTNINGLSSQPSWPAPERFADLVEEALGEIPDALWQAIDNVAVTVEEWPSARQQAVAGPRSLLLGLYEGVPLTARSTGYGLIPPDKITIFRRPILQICGADEALIRAQVRRTVLHEVAHHFGISDERLRSIGAY